MKRTVALVLVALFILGTTAFGQGIRIEKKKVAAPPPPEIVEQEIEIELEDFTVPGCPSCEAKKDAAKGGCGGCKGDGKCGKKVVETKAEIAIAGGWNKLPADVKEQMLKELRARYDDETLKKILKSLAAGGGTTSIGGGKGGGVTIMRTPPQFKGKMVVAKPGEHMVVLEGDPKVQVRGRIVMKDGEEDLEAVIEDLKVLREQMKGAKNAADLRRAAEALKKARVRVESSRRVVMGGAGGRHVFVAPKAGGQVHGMITGGGAPTLGRMFVMRGNDSAPAGCPHCAPKAAPRCGCQDRARRPAPKCGCQGQARGGRPHGQSPFPQPPRHAGFDDGLRHSLDALRGEISGLRHELRAMRAMHQASMKKAAMGKAAGSFKMSGVAPGAYRVAMKHPPAPPKPGTPPKAVAGGKGAAGAAWGTPKKYTWTKAGGMSFGVVPAKQPDPRQMHLEKEVANLKKEMGHMKAMMHEMLKKLDDMQKQDKK